MLKKNLLKISDFSRAVYRPERSESCSLMLAYQVCPLWRGKEWRLTAARPLARSHANMSLWRDPFQGVTGHSRPRWNKSDVSPSRLWNSILPHRLGEAWEVINNRNHCGNHWGGGGEPLFPQASLLPDSGMQSNLLCFSQNFYRKPIIKTTAASQEWGRSRHPGSEHPACGWCCMGQCQTARPGHSQPVAELFKISERETRLFQVESSDSPTVIRKLSSLSWSSDKGQYSAAFREVTSVEATTVAHFLSRRPNLSIQKKNMLFFVSLKSYVKFPLINIAFLSSHF